MLGKVTNKAEQIYLIHVSHTKNHKHGFFSNGPPFFVNIIPTVCVHVFLFSMSKSSLFIVSLYSSEKLPCLYFMEVLVYCLTVDGMKCNVLMLCPSHQCYGWVLEYGSQRSYLLCTTYLTTCLSVVFRNIKHT